jgi:MYXO-CTERM domain-containing protein
VVCTSSFTGNPQTTLDLYTAGSKSGSYTAVFGGVEAFSVQIRLQATDFVSTTNSNPHATGAVTDAQSPGLSTGAKAGIGVGVAIGVLALLLLGALLLRRRRRKPKTDQTPVTDQMPYGIDTKQELDGTSYATPKVKDVSPPVAELDASKPHSDFTSSQPGTRIRDPTASGNFAAGGAEPQTQANLTSTEPSPLVAPHARSEDDIRQQIKRIREQKERLTRINELERLEAELQERLAGPTTTGN